MRSIAENSASLRMIGRRAANLESGAVSGSFNVGQGVPFESKKERSDFRTPCMRFSIFPQVKSRCDALVRTPRDSARSWSARQARFGLLVLVWSKNSADLWISFGENRIVRFHT